MRSTRSKLSGTIELSGIAFFLFFSFQLLSQPVQFECSFHNINSESGLNSSEVYKVGQDSKGRIWFCTDAGATVFDGYYYKTYTIQNGLLDNVIFDFYEDHHGRIWFLAYNSMLCFLEGDKIVPYQYNNEIRKLIGSTTVAEKMLYIDEEDNLYYTMRYFGLLKISKEGKIERMHKNMNTVEILKVDDRYVVSFRYDRLDPNYDSNYRFINPSSPRNGNNMAFRKDLNRLYYASSEASAHKNGYLLIQDQIFFTGNDTQIYKGKGVLRMGEFADGKFWIGTIEGLFIGHVDAVKGFVLEKEYLSGNSVTGVFTDHEGGCWIATLNNGVYYANNFDVEFAGIAGGLMNQNVVDLTVHKGQVWASFMQGWQNVSTGKMFLPESSSYSKLHSTGENLVISDRKNHQVNFHNDEIHVPYASDFCLYGNAVYMSSSCVMKINREKKKLDTIYNSLTDHTSRRQNIFSSITVGPENRIYLGSQSGLYVINNINQIDFYPDSVTSVSCSVTDLLYHDKLGILVGTSNKGVLIIRDGQVVQQLDKTSGLSSNVIRCMLVEKNGQLIIGTNKGLNVVSKDLKKIKYISRNQGLVSNEITALVEGEGYLYVGTKNGLFRITEDFLNNLSEESNSSVYIQSITFGNDIVPFSGQYLEIPQSTRILKVKFRTTNYRNWFNKKYQYRLSKNDEWETLNAPEILVLHPSGSFSFEVRYMNDKGNWSAPVELFRAKTIIPFWKTIYFWIIVMLCILGTLFLIYRSRQLNIQKQLKLQNEMLSLEQRMQNIRMNPHFVFNILNSIQSCLILNKPELANMYLSKFSSHMRNVLISAGSSKIRIADKIDILKNYIELEQLRFNNSFDYSISADNIDRSQFIPSIVVQPFVENAIIHGIRNNVHKRGLVEVEFKQLSNDAIQITVSDNGESSLSDADELLKVKASHAIAITMVRLRNYNRSLKNSIFGLTTNRTGGDHPKTTVVLVVPVLSDENAD